MLVYSVECDYKYIRNICARKMSIKMRFYGNIVLSLSCLHYLTTPIISITDGCEDENHDCIVIFVKKIEICNHLLLNWFEK